MTESNAKQKSAKRKLGFGLIIISTILFIMIPVVPFLVEGSQTKIAAAAVLAIAAEITFWIGGFILGKEVVQKYRGQLNPMRFFKKKDDSET